MAVYNGTKICSPVKHCVRHCVINWSYKVKFEVESRVRVEAELRLLKLM